MSCMPAGPWMPYSVSSFPAPKNHAGLCLQPYLKLQQSHLYPPPPKLLSGLPSVLPTSFSPCCNLSSTQQLEPSFKWKIQYNFSLQFQLMTMALHNTTGSPSLPPSLQYGQATLPSSVTFKHSGSSQLFFPGAFFFLRFYKAGSFLSLSF